MEFIIEKSYPSAEINDEHNLANPEKKVIHYGQLQALLKMETSQQPTIKGIIIQPGWFIDRDTEQHQERYQTTLFLLSETIYYPLLKKSYAAIKENKNIQVPKIIIENQPFDDNITHLATTAHSRQIEGINRLFNDLKSEFWKKISSMGGLNARQFEKLFYTHYGLGLDLSAALSATDPEDFEWFLSQTGPHLAGIHLSGNHFRLPQPFFDTKKMLEKYKTMGKIPPRENAYTFNQQIPLLKYMNELEKNKKETLMRHLEYAGKHMMKNARMTGDTPYFLIKERPGYASNTVGDRDRTDIIKDMKEIKKNIDVYFLHKQS